MPRVNTAKKNKGGTKRNCRRCGGEIKPGEKYFYYKFRYGPTFYHCVAHYPKPSDLTRSKMSAAYAAIETADAEIENVRKMEDVASLPDILERCADEIEAVHDEYQDGLDNMPDSLREAATETQDKIDELESFADSLRSVDIETEKPEDQDQEEWVIEQCDTAQGALDEFSL